MKKPPDLAIWLYKNWPIHGVKVTYEARGDAEADCFVTVASAGGTKRMTDTEFDELTVLERHYNSICDLKTQYKEHVAAWLIYEKENEAELAQYELLKKKFET